MRTHPCRVCHALLSQVGAKGSQTDFARCPGLLANSSANWLSNDRLCLWNLRNLHILPRLQCGLFCVLVLLGSFCSFGISFGIIVGTSFTFGSFFGTLFGIIFGIFFGNLGLPFGLLHLKRFLRARLEARCRSASGNPLVLLLWISFWFCRCLVPSSVDHLLILQVTEVARHFQELQPLVPCVFSLKMEICSVPFLSLSHPSCFELSLPFQTEEAHLTAHRSGWTKSASPRLYSRQSTDHEAADAMSFRIL